MSTEIDPAARRGAENVVRRCLGLRAGERVAILTWRAAALVRLLEDACADAGARAKVIATDARAGAGGDLDRWVADAVEDATASVLLAEHGLPPPLSMAVLDVARRKQLRHLHLTRADAKLFAQSYRAEPEQIAAINQRVVDALGGTGELRARSPAGTDVRVQIARALPRLAADGRPAPGRPDNLPSGFVFFHPGSVDGTVVADRGLLGAIRVGRDRLRGTKIEIAIEGGRVRDVRCDDAAIRGEIEGYLASHPNAGRVGLVVLPTNYVVRAESGLDVQDALLPGIGIGLGYSDHEHTRAPFSCPVQLRLLGRKLDVDAGARALVRGGRFADDLVAGADPFR